MSDMNEEAIKVKEIAAAIRAESEGRNVAETAGACCFVKTPSGYTTCFEWDGMTAADCVKIGQQAGGVGNWAPGQHCG